MTGKKSLKARDIERLENTSFASVFLGEDVDATIEIDGVTTGDCSYSCPGECTCGCQSFICCATNECDVDVSSRPEETCGCQTAIVQQ